ncbi:MFS transporter [Actinoallomurus bryophytorum]|uniref:Nitrate/nitrite transporter NarK n=1 Tax=Actinoallomurus bryophytorum TaxID=1490222 RepID=A0A543CEF6_9ACTN|nr:MFS transporter [Actinoallomurus bryophytorum]TQL95327.1 nitrate/nitrite transporter NarK [Actinoallomurus bryophytorum]
MTGVEKQARLGASPIPLRPGKARQWWPAGLAVAAVGWGAQQFAPLLLLYQARLHLSATVTQATFGLYIFGLIPGLLLGGPFSDRYGRRRVMAPTLVASAAATVLLMSGGAGVGGLFAGRLLAGVASGAAFSSGAAWIKELSAAGSPGGGGHAPRRITVAMSAGFGLGPLVAGVLAQWAPAPTVLPYLPHLGLAAVALPAVLRTPETRVPDVQDGLLRQLRVPEAGDRRFRRVVVPLAPWVFGSVAVAMAYLPWVVKDRLAGYTVVFSAAVTLLTAFAGIFVQPLARRVDVPGRPRLLATSMAIVVAGTLIAALAAAVVQPVLVVVAALVLGAGYGCCQVCGLIEVQRLAGPGHLAGLTAVYQAVSYLGLVVSLPLAAATQAVPAGVLLLVVAALAALTLAWTAAQAREPGEARLADDLPERRAAS